MFYLFELQTTGETGAPLVNTYTNREDALAGFYYTSSFAVKSEVPYHTVMVVDQSGNIIESKTFFHPTVKPETATE